MHSVSASVFLCGALRVLLALATNTSQPTCDLERISDCTLIPKDTTKNMTCSSWYSCQECPGMMWGTNTRCSPCAGDLSSGCRTDDCKETVEACSPCTYHEDCSTGKMCRNSSCTTELDCRVLTKKYCKNRQYGACFWTKGKCISQCRKGTHAAFELNTPSLLSNHGDLTTFHVILSAYLHSGHAIQRSCREMMRGMDWEPGSDSAPTLQNTRPAWWLYGTIHIMCNTQGEVKAVNNNCWEPCRLSTALRSGLLNEATSPWSALDLPSKPPSSLLSGGQLEDGQQLSFLLDSEWGVHACDCLPRHLRIAEVTLTLPQGADQAPLRHGKLSSLSTTEAALYQAWSACEKQSGCVAVAISQGVQPPRAMLLRATVCNAPVVVEELNETDVAGLGNKSHPDGFTNESTAIWWGPNDVMPLGTELQVLEAWSPSDEAAFVRVTVPGLSYFSTFGHNLQKVGTTPVWSIVRRLRSRKVVCNNMLEMFSCHVADDSSVKILKLSDTPEAIPKKPTSEELLDCRYLCEDEMKKMMTSRACCGLSHGTCALVRGESFHVFSGSSFDPLNFGSPKGFRGVPYEHATGCRSTGCVEDDEDCPEGELTHFEPPQDVPCPSARSSCIAPEDAAAAGSSPSKPGTGEGENDEGSPYDVDLYFDFSRPFSMPMFMLPANVSSHGYPVYYHNLVPLKPGEKGCQRPPKHLDNFAFWRRVGSTMSSSAHLATQVLPKGIDVAEMSTDELEPHQEVFEAACLNASAYYGRTLMAPFLIAMPGAQKSCLAELPDEEVKPLTYEACLHYYGCKEVPPKGEWKPAQSPWLPNLPFDWVLRHYPVPMCCVRPYRDDMVELARESDMMTVLGHEKMELDEQGKEEAERVKKRLTAKTSQSTAELKVVLREEVQSRGVMDEIVTQLVGWKNWLSQKMSSWFDDEKDREEKAYEDQQEVSAFASLLEFSDDLHMVYQAHPDGDCIAPSGKAAFLVGNWSYEHAGYVQLRDHKFWPTLWNILKAGGRLIWKVYEGLKWLIKKIGPKLWAMAQWMFDNPSTCLLFTRALLEVRNLICETLSDWMYGRGVQNVSFFGWIGNRASDAADSVSEYGSEALLHVAFSVQKMSESFLKPMLTNLFALYCLFPPCAFIKPFVPVVADFIVKAGKALCGKWLLEAMSEHITRLFNDPCLFQRKDEVITSFWWSASSSFLQVDRQEDYTGDWADTGQWRGLGGSSYSFPRVATAGRGRTNEQITNPLSASFVQLDMQKGAGNGTDAVRRQRRRPAGGSGRKNFTAARAAAAARGDGRTDEKSIRVTASGFVQLDRQKKGSGDRMDAVRRPALAWSSRNHLSAAKVTAAHNQSARFFEIVEAQDGWRSSVRARRAFSEAGRSLQP